MVKRKEAGLLAELVMIKVGQNLAEEKTHQKELKEDADQLVPLVKLTKGEREHNVAKYLKG